MSATLPLVYPLEKYDTLSDPAYARWCDTGAVTVSWTDSDGNSHEKELNWGNTSVCGILTGNAGTHRWFIFSGELYSKCNLSRVRHYPQGHISLQRHLARLYRTGQAINSQCLGYLFYRPTGHLVIGREHFVGREPEYNSAIGLNQLWEWAASPPKKFNARWDLFGGRSIYLVDASESAYREFTDHIGAADEVHYQKPMRVRGHKGSKRLPKGRRWRPVGYYGRGPICDMVMPSCSQNTNGEPILSNQRPGEWRVGVELEMIESLNHPDGCYYKHDGSVNGCGLEWLPEKPWDLATLPEAIYDALRHAEWVIDDSCGGHVHVSGWKRSSTPASVKMFACAGAGYIFRDFGARLRHAFAAPARSDEISYTLQWNPYTRGAEDEEPRYRAINLCAVSSHGTVEFRFWTGFENCDDVLQKALCSVGMLKLVDMLGPVGTAELADEFKKNMATSHRRARMAREDLVNRIGRALGKAKRHFDPAGLLRRVTSLRSIMTSDVTTPVIRGASGVASVSALERAERQYVFPDPPGTETGPTDPGMEEPRLSEDASDGCNCDDCRREREEID